MPHGDIKYRESSGSHSRRVSYGSSYEYDDEGRGGSKSLWEWFEEHFNDASEKKVWLMSQDDDICYRLIRGSVLRFGIEDIAVTSSPDVDSRARRLVSKELSKIDWNEYWQHLVEGYQRERGRLEKQRQESNAKWQEEWQAEARAREARLAQVRDDDVAKTSKMTELSAGSLHADFLDVFTFKERSGADEGDWIEDAVEGATTGHAFGFEQRQSGNVKLQITLSLDMSNSMYYNRIHVAAAKALYEIGQTMRALREEWPNDLYVAFFEFSLNGYGGSDRGKVVNQLSGNDKDFGPFSDYKPSETDNIYGTGRFEGEDTWISPLLATIEKWETKESDPGAIKLDLIITDAVLEHNQDIIEGSKIQDRRDGALQTILLNLMPESEWGEVSLPRRCYQYHVDAENLSGDLRHIISEFVNVQL